MQLTRDILSEKLKSDPSWRTKATIFLSDLVSDGKGPPAEDMDDVTMYNVRIVGACEKNNAVSGKKMPVPTNYEQMMIELLQKPKIVDFLFAKLQEKYASEAKNS